MDLAIVQIVQRVVGGAELVFAGMKRHEAPVRQRHQLDKFGIGADEIADDGLFRGDHVDSRNVDFSAITHDVVLALVAGHREAVGDGVTLADEIDDSFRAAPGGQFKNLAHFIAVSENKMVGAAFFGEIK